MIRKATRILGLLVPALTISTGVCQQRYTVTQIPTLGQPEVVAAALNESGQVVGYDTDYPYVPGSDAAFLYTGATVQPLGSLGGGDEAYGINRSGQIAGTSYTSSGAQTAFLYSNGVMQSLNIPAPDSSASGINASGQVVGDVFPESGGRGNPTAYIWSNGVTTLLELPGQINSTAAAVNDLGEVVGQSDGQAFLYSNDVMHRIGNLGGNDLPSVGEAINQLGEVVGDMSVPGSGYMHGFSYANGQLTDLGTLAGGYGYSDAAGINDSGVIVGNSWIKGDVNHAYVYEAGHMYDLNSLLTGTDLPTLNDVTAINDAGQIVALAYDYDGHPIQSFLLTPVSYQTPAPTAAITFFTAGLFRRRRNRLNNPPKQKISRGSEDLGSKVGCPPWIRTTIN